MFWHNFKYTLKILVGTKGLIFWTLIFPIILGTFFKLAFSEIENSEKLKTFDIAIIENDEFRTNEIFKNAFQELDGKIFRVKYVDENGAHEMLENNEVIGILKIDNNEPKLFFKANGIEQTIFKNIVDEIDSTGNLTKILAENEFKKGNYNFDFTKISTIENPNLKNISRGNLSYTTIEFFSLVAMVCLYSAFFGCVALSQNLASASSQGRRVSVAPTRKSVVIFSSACASYLIQLFMLAILFAFLIFVLKINFGNHLLPIILLSICGSFAGLSFGIFVAASFRKDDNFKTGIIIAATMFGCFLAGMMGVTMKYIVDKNFPIANMINPANMITDGFYALYYYGVGARFYFNLFSLLIFAAIFLAISLFNLRKQKYARI